MSAALVFDCETVPTESAMAAPYPESERQPPGNYKAAEAIDGWRERDRVKWREERAKECSLNPRLGRIVCVGFCDTDELETVLAVEEKDEADVLLTLWSRIAEAEGQIITFNGLTFDLPFFLVRSLVRGIKPMVPVKTVRDWTRRYSYAPHFDVRAVLTQWDNRTTGTLNDWAKAFGIEVTDTSTGADVWAQYQAGEFDKIAEHCRADVATTAALYEKVSQMYGEVA